MITRVEKLSFFSCIWLQKAYYKDVVMTTPSRWKLVTLLVLALATKKRVWVPDVDVPSARSPFALASPKET